MDKEAQEYKADLQALMAHYGFVEMPLTDFQIEALCNRGIAVEFAYDIASDVAAGFEFWEALSTNT